MTAKEAIKARCYDCNEGHKDCSFIDCPLFGLKRASAGCNRVKAIKEYCKQCMNDNPVRECISVGCPIYQYRNKNAIDALESMQTDLS